MTEEPNIVLTRENRLGWVTINRPQALNALNHASLLELKATFESLREEKDVQVVVVTGSGGKAFVAGADIKELMSLDPLDAKKTSELGQSVFNLIERYPKPVIAAIDGFCLGGGCELALACHIRIASEKAKFGQPELKLGLIPGYGGTQRLPRLVGKGRALELILTGEMIAAHRAYEIGLVNCVVETDQLTQTCQALAEKIIQNGPLAVQYTIEAVNTGLEMPLTEGLALESILFGLCSATEDMKEGTRAFVEKRKAVFKGK